MKAIFSTICLFFALNLIGQSSFPAKEHFDKIYPTFDYYHYQYESCNLRGNYISWDLMSLLRMYQATKDKAYLVKLINHCIKIQSKRYDEINVDDPPVWVRKEDDVCDNVEDDVEPAYFNYLLTYPMAEFVYTIIMDQDLYNTPLPLSSTQNIIDISTLNSMMPPFSIISYGDFARWLGYRLEQTIAYFNSEYWDATWGIKSHDGDCSGGKSICGAGMNQASPYASTLLFMALCNTNFGYDANRVFYLGEAKFLASLFKQARSLDGCNNTSYNSNSEFALQPNDSYVWYPRAVSYKKDNCGVTKKDDIPWYTELYEDVAHGGMDLWFIQDCYDVQLSDNNSNLYFALTDMVRFSNTFSKNIYFENSSGPHFHNNVFGTEITTDCGSDCSTPDRIVPEVLIWAVLSEYDDFSNADVYGKLMNYTKNFTLNSNIPYGKIQGGTGMVGLTEVIKAQWDKECTDLTLYNRDVAYSQYFFAKHDLHVVPQQYDDLHSKNAKSFANPEITTNEFIMEANTEVKMTAGASIVLGPGVHIESGSTFHAYIDELLCSAGSKSMSVASPINNLNNNNAQIGLADTVVKEFSVENSNNDVYQNTFSISPNPFNGSTQVHLTVAGSSHIKITITDMYGVKVNTITDKDFASGNYTFDWNASGRSPGIYFCILETPKETVSKRIILTK